MPETLKLLHDFTSGKVRATMPFISSIAIAFASYSYIGVLFWFIFTVLYINSVRGGKSHINNQVKTHFTYRHSCIWKR